jgi:hypothetical protein
VAESYQQAFDERRQATLALVDAHHRAIPRQNESQIAQYHAAQKQIDRARTEAARLVERSGGEKGFSDTNYIFLSFVTKYLPAGIVGLVIAVIFAATMSASSGEINSLATVTIVDLYRRHSGRAPATIITWWHRAWPRCSGVCTPWCSPDGASGWAR